MPAAELEHTFSIELKSRASVKQMCLSSSRGNQVVFEGVLGELVEVRMIEDAFLEIRGSNGALCIDISSKELEKVFPRDKK